MHADSFPSNSTKMPIPQKTTRTWAAVAAPAPAFGALAFGAPAAGARAAGDSASSAAPSIRGRRRCVPERGEFVTVGKDNRMPSGKVKGRKPYFNGEYNGTLSDEKEDVADER